MAHTYRGSFRRTAARAYSTEAFSTPTGSARVTACGLTCEGGPFLSAVSQSGCRKSRVPRNGRSAGSISSRVAWRLWPMSWRLREATVIAGAALQSGGKPIAIGRFRYSGLAFTSGGAPRAELVCPNSRLVGRRQTMLPGPEPAPRRFAARERRGPSLMSLGLIVDLSGTGILHKCVRDRPRFQ